MALQERLIHFTDSYCSREKTVILRVAIDAVIDPEIYL
jgi:hypothetical protein